MASRRCLMGLLGLLTLLSTTRADDPPLIRLGAPAAMPAFPLDGLAPDVRAGVQAVLAHPTLSSKGAPETFNASRPIYHWLLEHPDLDVKLWRLIGAKVMDVSNREGVYSWQDGQGSEVFWRIVHRSDGLHAWYAEGKMKLGMLLPASPFRAVAVLRYTHGKDMKGKPAIRHQVYFMLRCDGRAMALATRILGASAPHMAEQYLGQLQMFYGGLAWYLSQDEDRARSLFRKVGLIVPEPLAVPESAPVSYDDR